jgi:hypothetical protein
LPILYRNSITECIAEKWEMSEAFPHRLSLLKRMKEMGFRPNRWSHPEVYHCAEINEKYGVRVSRKNYKDSIYGRGSVLSALNIYNKEAT